MNLHETNRARLVEACEGGLIVVAAYDQMQLSGDMAAPFLQDASFWWLTGIEEPGWKLVIDGTRGGRATLFRPEKNDVQKIFDGEVNDSAVVAVSGIEDIRSMKDFEHELRQWRRMHPLVKTLRQSDDGDFVLNPARAELGKLLSRIFASVEDCTKQIQSLRAIKQPEEIKRLKAAVKLTVDAFAETREKLGKMKHEYEIEAGFTHAFRSHNATHAYQPIVASGAHACTLHYDKNSGQTSKRQGVLIDIGARVDGYSADITRTYCQNPTKRFREVYDALEKAHHRIIALIKPMMPVGEYGQSVDEIMKDALQQIGLLNDRSDTATYRKYFPHAVSHGLGVDTHDSLGAPRYLLEGMVLTVEPGIYIPEEEIGIRIEDDILVTATGSENLSARLSTSL